MSEFGGGCLLDALDLTRAREGTRRFREPLRDGTHRSNNTHSHTGSIYSVGRNFQPFRINNLEMVAQICPRWNRTTDWLKGLDEFRIAA
jgi:hypothetical protein